jgi:hypothetical protein
VEHCFKAGLITNYAEQNSIKKVKFGLRDNGYRYTPPTSWNTANASEIGFPHVHIMQIVDEFVKLLWKEYERKKMR